jgi:hypothetical protein
LTLAPAALIGAIGRCIVDTGGACQPYHERLALEMLTLTIARDRREMQDAWLDAGALGLGQSVLSQHGAGRRSSVPARTTSSGQARTIVRRGPRHYARSKAELWGAGGFPKTRATP